MKLWQRLPIDLPRSRRETCKAAFRSESDFPSTLARETLRSFQRSRTMIRKLMKKRNYSAMRERTFPSNSTIVILVAEREHSFKLDALKHRRKSAPCQSVFRALSLAQQYYITYTIKPVTRGYYRSPSPESDTRQTGGRYYRRY